MMLMKAVLLLGATGTGKSPLGDYLEVHGVGDRRCFHFDFGNNLRKAAEGGFDEEFFSSDDVQVVRNVLQTGALLEDETFYIAERILHSFIVEKGVSADDLIVLNGMPRHLGQANAVDSIIHVEMVIHLDCTPENVVARIESNSGGDRTDRIDDSLLEVRNKLDIFNRRTIPLLDHYHDKNVKILRVDVGLRTSPNEIAEQLREFEAEL